MVDNFRPTQPLGGRTVYYSTTPATAGSTITAASVLLTAGLVIISKVYAQL